MAAAAKPERLAACYQKCLELAEERGARTISFPAISTGVYGYPLAEAAGIAAREVRAHLEKRDTTVEKVIFVLFGRSAYEAYEKALRE